DGCACVRSNSSEIPSTFAPYGCGCNSNPHHPGCALQGAQPAPPCARRGKSRSTLLSRLDDRYFNRVRISAPDKYRLAAILIYCDELRILPRPVLDILPCEHLVRTRRDGLHAESSVRSRGRCSIEAASPSRTHFRNQDGFHVRCRLLTI